MLPLVDLQKLQVLQPTIADKRNVLVKDVEPVLSLQNGQKDKDNFIAEETYNYYPADNVYQRRPHYGPVAFPDYSPHDNYYPYYKPQVYVRDPYFWNGHDAYNRRRFNGV